MSEGTNPWLSQPAAPIPAVRTIETAPVAQPTGPIAPQRDVRAPDRVDQLATYDRPQAALWLLGAHGGAGESTLAGLVPGWAAADHSWPRHPDGDAPARVVLLARSNAHGLQAAQAAATQWAAGLVPHVEVLGLVIVADAPGRLPRPLRDLAQLVGGGVPRTWSVPWVESWRLGEPPALTDAPREVRRLVDELTALITPGASSTVH